MFLTVVRNNTPNRNRVMAKAGLIFLILFSTYKCWQHFLMCKKRYYGKCTAGFFYFIFSEIKNTHF